MGQEARTSLALENKKWHWVSLQNLVWTPLRKNWTHLSPIASRRRSVSNCFFLRSTELLLPSVQLLIDGGPCPIASSLGPIASRRRSVSNCFSHWVQLLLEGGPCLIASPLGPVASGRKSVSNYYSHRVQLLLEGGPCQITSPIGSNCFSKEVRI